MQNKPKFDPQKHHRKSIRLPGYDYSQAGGYYVTIVTYHRDCLFGEIVNKETPQGGCVFLSDFGKIADECWRAIPEHFPFVELGAYVIMPNHVHGIIVVTDDRRGTIYTCACAQCRCRAPTRASITEKFGKPTIGSLPTIVRTYKSAVTRRIGRELSATGIWQRNYYEHISRDEKDLQSKTDYINSNPLLWDEDDNNQLNYSSL